MLIRFVCNLCGNEIKKIFKTKQEIPPFLTCHCSGVLEKQLPDVSTTSLEIVDNGSMARKVELRKDAVERHREKGDIYIKTMNDRERILKKDEN